MTREKLTKENSCKIDAKRLSEDCKIAAKTNKNLGGKSVSDILGEIGLSTSVISNSTRSYWIHFSGDEDAKAANWGAVYGRVAFAPGYTKGFIKYSDFAKILKTFDLKAASYLTDEYTLNEDPFDENEESFEKDETNASDKYIKDLKEIKELLTINNILLEKLLKEWGA